MDQDYCLIIPAYNNAATLLQVIDSAKPYAGYIIVVNDGSTDQTQALLQGVSGVEVVEYERNRGKGYALRCGFKRALQAGFRYAITIDADGQHYPSDIPCFIEAIAAVPDSLLIGSRLLQQENMPAKNSFANRFSNFWYHLQTLHGLPDTQSGFRLYPIQKMRRMHFFCNRYEAELEMLVRLSWRFITVKAIPVSVYYAPVGERVSHFRPFRDFFRISMLNTLLTLIAIVYFYPKWMVYKFCTLAKI
ncbi:MAG: glycosyltransferase family 2 protein [Bacteroidales bacterium]|jgi:glycosyltransferase involved in cell wall biosynthesis|nr:glycosyltransferase family 2 protein [Bacteroidales bacterium]